MIEIFKNIDGYEDLYQVSNLGHILSLAKGDGNGNKDRLLKLEKCVKTSTTYLRVTLCKEGKIRRFLVHRLVAKAFIPNLLSKPHINHIDNNGSNNIIDNLEWCTPHENMQHSVKQGRQKQVIALAVAAARKINQEKAEKKYITLLGNRFIKTECTLKNNKYKRYVTFLCKHCKGTFTMRSDCAPLRIRDGVCNHCKEEDIV